MGRTPPPQNKITKIVLTHQERFIPLFDLALKISIMFLIVEINSTFLCKKVHLHSEQKLQIFFAIRDNRKNIYINYCIYEATYMTTDDDGGQPTVHLSNLGNIIIYNKNMVTTATIELYQPINLYLPRHIYP